MAKTKQHILIAGGAGYIGSQMALMLAEAGHDVVVLDNLVSGHEEAVAVSGARLVTGDIGDAALVGWLLDEGRPDAVLHFAALIEAGQSVREPERYLENNHRRTLVFLDVLTARDVPPPLVFSSTAAIYGEPETIPIPEDHPTKPINPYGESKLLVEQALAARADSHGLRWAALRYFNAAGADPGARLGERHEPETHLIPLALHTALGKRAEMVVNGSDYDTPDGTCIRDYVHVLDLCRAHMLALEHLRDGGESGAFNLGGGEGRSVLQVLQTVERVTGKALPVRHGPRRPGDPARLVADIAKAKRVLNWEPTMSDLDTIVEHAWAWERKRPG
ncbi:UDP-glucose 4-epimerase GalE [Oceanibaculum nanhaiense]|uniref:UDP-glucose 4-epimerase GalE n=1 Tax=Oceanibaculum nanhaiense TaxID=1909734 RepID=UPI001FEC4DE0|nr:UDP-glucose 4-epimerase GalE [Oceanibaculum nanhaiense]